MRIAERNTEELENDRYLMIHKVIASSDVIRQHEETHAAKTNPFVYTTVQMVFILFLMEVRKCRYKGLRTFLNGKDGQELLSKIGGKFSMGSYRVPSTGKISRFVNTVWKEIGDDVCEEFGQSYQDMLEKMGEEIIATMDSTPVIASRYSPRAEFNGHYMVHMYKAHIVMINGFPRFMMSSNANHGDGEVFRTMLEFPEAGAALRAAFGTYTDGAYNSFETYAAFFLATGKVMSSNIAKNHVYHENAEWSDIIEAYTKFWNEDDWHGVHKDLQPETILRYLCRKGKTELVGKFLRNLDMRRGERIRKRNAKKRHVCETAHHGFKRWIDFDVFGLRKESESARLTLKLFSLQLLSALFKPYV